MTVSTVQQLEVYGPDRCEAMSVDHARAWCRRLAAGHYENFSVLSGFVPRDRHDDFAAVYSFCRWADDLGDEFGDPGRSGELLEWWRRELHQCYDRQPRHPVFLALLPTIDRFDLPRRLFDDLIEAFLQDQRVSRYQTWDQLIDYCRLSANPVGRLVLMMLGEGRREELFAASDAICTALQLTNHWQDINRDIRLRNRIYIPRELIRIDRFEPRLVATVNQGHCPDQEFFQQTRELVRRLVERTWRMYERGSSLPGLVSRPSRLIVWLFAAGGQRVLRLIELGHYETVLHRPRLSRLGKFALVARGALSARFGALRGSRS